MEGKAEKTTLHILIVVIIVFILVTLGSIIISGKGHAVELEYDGRVEYTFTFSEEEAAEILSEHLAKKGFSIPDGKKLIGHVGTRTILTIERRLLMPPGMKMPEDIRRIERRIEP